MFPIEAICTEPILEPVDIDNPEHEQYVQEGLDYFTREVTTEGFVIRVDILDRLVDDKWVKDKYALFAEKHKDYTLSYVPLSWITIPEKHFINEIRRIRK